MSDEYNGEAGVVEETAESHRQLAKVDVLPADLALLKMENEQIFTIARIKPREWGQIVKQLNDLIDAYPAAADEAIYCKPVGTVFDIVCGGCEHKYQVPFIPKKGVFCPKCESQVIAEQKATPKYAEGLSIRAAESIRSIVGFTRLSTTMETLADDRIALAGVLVDYCAGNITADQRIVSPFYKSRYGKMERHPEDRFINVICKAEKAKLRRDVILDSVPNIVKAAFRDACEKKLESLAKTENVEKNVLPYFISKGMTKEQVEKIVGRPLVMKWTQADIIHLRKIKNALENEETTVAELLGDVEPKPTTSQPAGPVSAEDLIKPTEQPQPPTAEETKPAESQSPPATETSKPDVPAEKPKPALFDGGPEPSAPAATGAKPRRTASPLPGR